MMVNPRKKSIILYLSFIKKLYHEKQINEIQIIIMINFKFNIINLLTNIGFDFIL